MKEKFMRFMSGRNGVDELNRFLLGVTLVCYFVSLFTNWSILYSIAVVLLFYFKNTTKVTLSFSFRPQKLSSRFGPRRSDNEI